LFTQWFNEIRKVTGDSLVCEYFDHNTGEFESRSTQQQQGDGVTKKVDIVITTYNAFDMTKASSKRKRGKHPATILKSICWKRVCRECTIISIATADIHTALLVSYVSPIQYSMDLSSTSAVDEMQELRSEKSSIAKNIEDVDCDRRWMVSGSPLFEGLGDLRGEIAFLRLVPFGANVEGMIVVNRVVHINRFGSIVVL
jgi:SNF2 family DNA or RNA helicase